MPELKRYHEIAGALHIGCEVPNAYFIPFESEESSYQNREKSEYFTSLCGEWKFKFYENAARIDIENSNFPESEKCDDSITVPGCWQLNLGKGYDVPNYINQDYPYPVDPPYIPDVIPAGLYRKTVEFSKKENKSYYINFEGVSSCFYLFVNGTFAGYSQVSHSSAIINISDYLINGSNTFDVLVVKHCDGSYFEDQDFFRLSGIFREVYITEREIEHISDIHIFPAVCESYDSAQLKVEIIGNQNYDYKLISHENEIISVGQSPIDIKIENPVLWNYEEPKLYTLIIHSGAEFINLKIGFKRFEIKNSCVFLNGKKVKAKGINRHDSNPETGYYVTEQQMIEELYSLKRANVNTIRTSHYPNDPRFYDYCDKLGFMVVDEADLETHGMGYNFGDWYWDYWAHLTNEPEYKEACVDRAKLLFERDKNHVCVIMWSLGNESGCGENHRAMAQYIRSRNKNAIIHYENAHLEYQARLGKDFSDISDVESRMYASIPYLKEYLEDDSLKKPFFYCEYVDSMSTGEIAAHWKDVEYNDKYFGGCVWEYCDHAVNEGTKENPKYRYGGDFGDWPNDNICCIDGLVYPDRKPRPGYYDMKKVYQPFEVKYNNGTISVFNKRFFTDFSDIKIKWSVEENGKIILDGTINDLNIPARKSENYILFDNKKFSSNTTLNVYFCLKHDTLWAKQDYEVGFEQFFICKGESPYSESCCKPISFTESRTDINISCGNIVYYFDKITAGISQITVDKTKLLDSPICFNMWRPATYNSRGMLDTWKRARYDKIHQKTYSTVAFEDDGKLIIKSEISLASAAMPPAVKADVYYTFAPDGSVTIRTEAKVTHNAPALPRFGLKFVLPKSFNQTSYLGYGPIESYSDRYEAARFSLFNSTTENEYEPYIKPQECSSHYKTIFAKVNNGKYGLEFNSLNSGSFCFKAIPYDDFTLHNTAHNDELPESQNTFVNIDYKILASNQKPKGEYPEREFDEKEFNFEIRILPVCY